MPQYHYTIDLKVNFINPLSTYSNLIINAKNSKEMYLNFFKIEKNILNNNYMVFSNCMQLLNCYSFKTITEAKAKALELNKIALCDYFKHCKELNLSFA